MVIAGTTHAPGQRGGESPRGDQGGDRMRREPGSSRGSADSELGTTRHRLTISRFRGTRVLIVRGSSRGQVQNFPGRLGSTEYLDRTQDGEQVAQTSARPCSRSECLIGRSTPQGLGDGSAHLLRPCGTIKDKFLAPSIYGRAFCGESAPAVHLH